MGPLSLDTHPSTRLLAQAPLPSLSPDCSWLAAPMAGADAGGGIALYDVRERHVPRRPALTIVPKSASSSSAALLLLCWASVAHLVVVTTAGVELHTVPDLSASTLSGGRAGKSKLARHISCKSVWCVYSVEARVLFCLTTRDRTTIQPFIVRDGSLAKMMKLVVDAPATGGPVLPQHFLPAFIYGKLYCVHVCPGHGFFTLYQVSREVIARKAILALPEPGASYAVSVADNMILLHHRDARETLVFDIKESMQRPIAPARPVGAPDANLFVTRASRAVSDPAAPAQYVVVRAPANSAKSDGRGSEATMIEAGMCAPPLPCAVWLGL